MGAATAILYCDLIGNDLVKCLVLDSGYSSVKKLAEAFAVDWFKIPLDKA
jgi:hypothetical protein